MNFPANMRNITQALNDDVGYSGESIWKFAAKAWTGKAKGQVCPIAALRRTGE